MTETLNLKTAAASSPGAENKLPDSQKRLGLLQSLIVGGGMAGGGTIVFGAFELIRSEPDKAFKLLHDWGPWVFLSTVITLALSKLLNRGLDMAERVGLRMADAMDSVAVQQRSLAAAGQAQAEAMQQTADKDDRNLQEMQTLTTLTAQRSEKTYAMLQAFHEDNQMILKSHQVTLERIEAKVDAKIAGAEKS